MALPANSIAINRAHCTIYSRACFLGFDGIRHCTAVMRIYPTPPPEKLNATSAGTPVCGGGPRLPPSRGQVSIALTSGHFRPIALVRRGVTQRAAAPSSLPALSKLFPHWYAPFTVLVDTRELTTARDVTT